MVLRRTVKLAAFLLNINFPSPFKMGAFWKLTPAFFLMQIWSKLVISTWIWSFKVCKIPAILRKFNENFRKIRGRDLVFRVIYKKIMPFLNFMYIKQFVSEGWFLSSSWCGQSPGLLIQSWPFCRYYQSQHIIQAWAGHKKWLLRQKERSSFIDYIFLFLRFI